MWGRVTRERGTWVVEGGTRDARRATRINFDRSKRCESCSCLEFLELSQTWRRWKTYVRTNPGQVRRPKTQLGEGLVGIEPDFRAWIIIGRDPKNMTASARRASFLNSAQNIHVQTWD